MKKSELKLVIMECIDELNEEDSQEKWRIEIKLKTGKKFSSKWYDDFDDVYDDFGPTVKKLAKQAKLKIADAFEYRYIKSSNE